MTTLRYNVGDVRGCWRWVGDTDSAGLPVLDVDGMPTSALRYVYSRKVGSLAPSEEVEQRCGNRACVRPGHLLVRDGVLELFGRGLTGLTAGSQQSRHYVCIPPWESSDPVEHDRNRRQLELITDSQSNTSQDNRQ